MVDRFSKMVHFAALPKLRPKPRTSSSRKWSGYTVSPRTLFRTVAPSSRRLLAKDLPLTYHLPKIGSPVRWPLHHREGDQSIRPPSPTPVISQGTPRISRVAGQASGRQRLVSNPRERRLGLGGQPDPGDPPPRTGVSLSRGLGGVWTGGPLMGPSVIPRRSETIAGLL